MIDAILASAVLLGLTLNALARLVMDRPSHHDTS